MPSQYQIIYFPYLCFQYNPIKFEKMVLWNFNREKEKMIPDDNLRNYLEKLLGANVSFGRPLQDIAVFSNEEPDFQLSSRKMRLATELKLILFLSVTANRNIHDGENAGHYMATSENFTHIFQNFQPGSEFTAHTSGMIVQTTSGGHEVGKIVYEKPAYVLQSNYRLDQELFSSLKTLKRKQSLIYRRVLRATDAFMNGYFNSHELSYESRILQQSRAFEILLQLPEKEQRKIFKQRIEFYCLPRDKKFHRKIRYLSERSGGRKEPEKGIMAVMWADRFYTLRNHIIHGDNIRTKEFLFNRQRHWDISLWVFLIVIKKVINETLKRDIFHDQILWQEGKFVYESGALYRSIMKTMKKFKGKRLP